MNVMVPIPDALAARFGTDLPRRALEALVLEEYRAGRLTNAELRELLDLATRHEMDGFLKAHGVYEDLTLDKIEDQVRAVEMQDSDRHAAADDLVARFRTFAAGHTLGGLDIKDLITEGRR